MDINDSTIKDELNNFVSSLQRLLPKKKDVMPYLEPLIKKPKVIKLSNIHIEAKSVFPQCFIGAKLVILRQIMDRVKLVQQYNFGKTKDSYKFYTHLINKELEPKHTDDGLLLDSTGSATATYNEVLDGGYAIRLTSKIKDLVSSETEVEVEKSNDKTMGSMRCSIKDVDPNTLKLVTQWMYQVVPEFGLGTEFSFKPLSYPPKPDMSISMRYDRPSFAISSTINRTGFQMCLFKQFSSDLRIATIAHEGSRGAPATIGLALHKTYQNGSELRIFVDSQKCGGFTFQKDVLFHEGHHDVRVVRLVCSTIIDRQRRVRLGFGFNLDF